MLKVRRVVCGVSGGVDSSVSALLLKQRGYDVIGLFMRNWDIRDEIGACSADEDREYAASACRRIGIPFHEVNFVKEYWTDVFEDFLKEYQHGLTPNPDILCNRYIKFGVFQKYAMKEFNADAVATGHYARNSFGENLEHYSPAAGARLLKAFDARKDQTFFLSQISQASLQRAIFPLGSMRKNMVKRIAKLNNLKDIAAKRESQGICFIGVRDFKDFISEYVENKPGNFIDVDTGKILGQHQGMHQWTIGQRCGDVGSVDAFYIVAKNVATNDIMVANASLHPSLYASSFFTGPAHWIHSPPPELLEKGLFHCYYHFQHVHYKVGCTLNMTSSNELYVSVDKSMRAITPGQYAVFYSGEECLGSAQILRIGPSLKVQQQYDKSAKYEKRLPDAAFKKESFGFDNV